MIAMRLGLIFFKLVIDFRSKPEVVGKRWLTPQSDRIEKVKAEKSPFLPSGDQLPVSTGNKL